MTPEQKEQMAKFLSDFFGAENVRPEDIWTLIDVDDSTAASTRARLKADSDCPMADVINKCLTVFYISQALGGHRLPLNGWFCVQPISPL